MSSKRKGRLRENEIAEYLAEKGYSVQKVPCSNKFQGIDFFDGMFDGIAFNSSHFLLYQVKSNGTSGWVKKAKDWLKINTLPPSTLIKLFVRYTKADLKKKFGKIREIDIK